MHWKWLAWLDSYPAVVIVWNCSVPLSTHRQSKIIPVKRTSYFLQFGKSTCFLCVMLVHCRLYKLFTLSDLPQICKESRNDGSRSVQCRYKKVRLFWLIIFPLSSLETARFRIMSTKAWSLTLVTVRCKKISSSLQICLVFENSWK